MYIVIAYCKGSEGRLVDNIYGPFSSREAAKRWAFGTLDSDPVTNELTVDVAVHPLYAPI